MEVIVTLVRLVYHDIPIHKKRTIFAEKTL